MNDQDDFKNFDDHVFSSAGPDGVDSSGEIRIPTNQLRVGERTPQVTQTAPSLTAKARLLIPSLGLDFDVDRSPYQIGGARAHLTLNDPFAAQWHVQLSMLNGKLLLEDLGSPNGVFLKIADPLPLQDGDEIAAGRQRFIFKTALPEAESKMKCGAKPPRTLPRLIEIFEGGIQGAVIPIKNELLIGTANPLFTALNDPDLLPRHSTLRADASGDFILTALDGKKGTFIRVHDPMELLHGDEFLVGATILKLNYI